MYDVYLGSSPKALCASGRIDDLTAIIDAIDAAEQFIYIAVGEYVPMDLFKQHKPWTMIDDRLRAGSLIILTDKYFLFFSNTNFTEKLMTSAGFELRSSEEKASTLTT